MNIKFTIYMPILILLTWGIFLSSNANAAPETCLACHTGLTPTQVQEWQTSGHAMSLETLKASPDAIDDCLTCHSTDYRKDPANVTLATAQLGNSCGSCHIDHIAKGRVAGIDSELLKPKKELCIDCHSSGNVALGEIPRSGQVDIFTGTGGFGVEEHESIHSRIMADACVTCHTPEVDEAQAAEGLGHTFKANLASCNTCHTDTDERIAKARQEISSQLEKLLPLLDSFEDKDSEEYKQAKYNVNLVKIGDKSGAHNLTYSKNLLDFSASVLETSAPTFPSWDVNQDGTVNIFDLVLVGGQFGQSGDNLIGDVNGDGTVNIFDLVLVGSHFGETTGPAAPLVAKKINRRFIMNWRPVLALLPAIKVGIELRPYRQGSEDLLIAEIKGNFNQLLYGYQFDLEFNPEAMELISVNQGTALGRSNEDAYSYAGQIDNRIGRWSKAAGTRVGPTGKVQTHGTLAKATFRAKRDACTTLKKWNIPPDLQIRLVNVRLVDADAHLLPYRIRESILSEYLATSTRPHISKVHQNFPNPFNPETWIPYELATPSHVEISIYNTVGQLVRRLDLGYREAGVYTTQQRAAFWDGSSDSGEPVATGVYYYQIIAGDFAEIGKMILCK